MDAVTRRHADRNLVFSMQRRRFEAKQRPYANRAVRANMPNVALDLWAGQRGKVCFMLSPLVKRVALLAAAPHITYTHTYIHTSHHITPHHLTSHHITSHYITLHYITLHYITYIHTYFT